MGLFDEIFGFNALGSAFGGAASDAQYEARQQQQMYDRYVRQTYQSHQYQQMYDALRQAEAGDTITFPRPPRFVHDRDNDNIIDGECVVIEIDGKKLLENDDGL